MMTITIAVFGAFRSVKCGEALQLSVPEHTTVKDLRPLLVSELKQRYPSFTKSDLVNFSVFADEHKILDDQFTLIDGLSIAILPPVCGG